MPNQGKLAISTPSLLDLFSAMSRVLLGVVPVVELVESVSEVLHRCLASADLAGCSRARPSLSLANPVLRDRCALLWRLHRSRKGTAPARRLSSHRSPSECRRYLASKPCVLPSRRRERQICRKACGAHPVLWLLQADLPFCARLRRLH